MSDGLKSGDRVLDLRAVTRAGGMFAGLVSASVATALLGWEWPWCVSTAVGCAVTGYVTATGVGRSVFPAPGVTR